MPPKVAVKPMRTLASFFAPILQRNVDEEHKVIVKNDAPVVEESKRKRPKTAKTASLSVTLRQSHPWAVVVTEPDPALHGRKDERGENCEHPFVFRYI